MYTKFNCSTWLHMEDSMPPGKKTFNHLKMKYSQDKDENFSKLNAKRITVNTLSQNLQNF